MLGFFILQKFKGATTYLKYQQLFIFDCWQQLGWLRGQSSVN